MYTKVANLLVFADVKGESILYRLASQLGTEAEGSKSKTERVRAAHLEVKRLLDLATLYGFDGNLWQNYLTYYLVTHENSFSLTAEGRSLSADGSIFSLVTGDMAIFRALFHYDFSAVEAELGVTCFSAITAYRSVEKTEKQYYRNVSRAIRALSDALAAADSDFEFCRILTDFYREKGVGMFGLNRFFRIGEGADGSVEFLHVNNTDHVLLPDIIGYERQKAQLVENTEAFLAGKPANNVLLYGDAGTGKSTCIKAIVNQYASQGLRMIEIYKHQFHSLSQVIGAIKGRNYKFIVYLDDLSFEETEVEYKFLKAVIEGGVETRPDNLLIYATSNRRHLVKETWRDRGDMEHDGDLHHSDTVEEKMSLAGRFGISIHYGAPTVEEFRAIVLGLAKQRGLTYDEEALLREAHAWEIRHGGKSGRCAKQFMDYLEGKGECGTC